MNQTGTATINGTYVNDNGSDNSEINSGTLVLKNTSIAGFHVTNIGGGASAPVIDNQSGSTITLDNTAQTWDGNFTFGSASTTGALSLGTGPFTLTGNRTITTANATYGLTAAGSISGTNGITKSGAGTLTLSASNSYSGGTIVNSGSLVLGNASSLGAATAPLAVNGGTVNLNGKSVIVGLLSGSSGGLITTSSTASSVLTAGGTGSSTYNGVIANGSGTVGLTKVGAGTLTLGGTNTYTGVTNVNNGTLAFDVSETLTGGLTVATSGTAVLTAHTGAAFVKVLDITGLTISGTTPFVGAGGKDLGGLASPAPVPETGTIGLLAVGAIGGLLLRRRCSRPR